MMLIRIGFSVALLALANAACSPKQEHPPRFHCSATDSAGLKWQVEDFTALRAKESALFSCEAGSEDASSCRIESCSE